MDIPDLFSHVKDLLKNQAEVTEENPEMEILSELPVTKLSYLLVTKKNFGN